MIGVVVNRPAREAGKPLLGLLRRRWAEAAIFQGIDATDAWNEIDDLNDRPTFT